LFLSFVLKGKEQHNQMKKLLLISMLLTLPLFGARSFMTGFELGSLSEGVGPLNYGEVQSTVVRSGNFAYRAHPTDIHSPAQKIGFASVAAGGVYRQLFRSSRFYIKVAALPDTGSVSIVRLAGAATFNPEVDLNPNGTLSIADSQIQIIATSTSALSVDGLWHRVEFDVGNGLKVYVDGTLWVFGIGVVNNYPTAASITFGAGESPTSVNALTDLYFDDILIDDDSFVNSGLPGDGSVVLLPSISNNSGTYTLTSYLAGGVSGTVYATQPICMSIQTGHGKTSGSIVSSVNPIDTAFTFDFGDAVITTNVGKLLSNPPVTFALQPTVTVTTSSRTQSIQFVGLYVNFH
jgi:hypothetical protein